jgi:hypothetical protein
MGGGEMFMMEEHQFHNFMESTDHPSISFIDFNILMIEQIYPD